MLWSYAFHALRFLGWKIRHDQMKVWRVARWRAGAAQGKGGFAYRGGDIGRPAVIAQQKGAVGDQTHNMIEPYSDHRNHFIAPGTSLHDGSDMFGLALAAN